MKLFSIVSLLGSVAAAPQPRELLLQVQELQAELSTQRQVIQDLQEERRLQAAESETRRMQGRRGMLSKLKIRLKSFECVWRHYHMEFLDMRTFQRGCYSYILHVLLINGSL